MSDYLGPEDVPTFTEDIPQVVLWFRPGASTGELLDASADMLDMIGDLNAPEAEYVGALKALGFKYLRPMGASADMPGAHIYSR